MYDLAVVIGRFQPFHLAHEHLIDEAYKVAKNVIVIIGSSFAPRTVHNPFTYTERSKMIKYKYHSIETIGVQDYIYDDTPWVIDVHNKVTAYADEKLCDSICLVGYTKDESSYYLKKFPQWEYHEISPYTRRKINATMIRESLFETNTHDMFIVNEHVNKFLRDFVLTEEFEALKAEYTYTKFYRQAEVVIPRPTGDNSIYKPIFTTVDAVVVCNEHILLIKRKISPGKGLWALPGGFLNPEEYLVDGALRELREETGLKVYKNQIVKTEVFDSPKRSLRGRIITHAYLIKLNATTLPKVKGADDAESAMWIPIAEVLNSQDKLFEDHWHIISSLI